MPFRGGMLDVVRRRREPILLATVLIVAFALRVFQFDWDQGHLYHPDERFILMSTAAISVSWPPNLAELFTAQSSLIPRDFSYSYGTFSFYLLRIVAAILVGLNQALPFLHPLDATRDLGNLRLIGRPISAIFDTASVFLIYRIGRAFYGHRVALLGATLVAFSVIDIQLSHFYATDTILTGLVLGAIAASASFLRSGRRADAVVAGVCCGFALATKASAVPILVPVALAQLLRLLADRPLEGVRLRRPRPEAVTNAAGIAVTTLAAAAIAFLIAEPFAVIDFKHFIAGISEQGSMVQGIADLPYTRQYFGRPAYLYFLQNLTLFGVGVPLGLSMIAGAAFVVGRNIRMPRAGDLMLLSYVLPYFAITGGFWTKFLRYMLPISPLLALFAAVLLLWIVDLARKWRAALTLAPEGNDEVQPEAKPSSAEGFEELAAAEYDLADLALVDGYDTVGDSRSEQEIETSRPVVLATSTTEVSLVGKPDVIAVADAETRRWFAMKGLSLDLLAPDDVARIEVAPNGHREPPSYLGNWTSDATSDDNTCHWAPPPAVRNSDWVKRVFEGSWPVRVAWALVAIVVWFSEFYSLGYDHMYASPTTPVQASEWLYVNAPRGSVLATEHWDEGMPVPVPVDGGTNTGESFNFQNVTMPMYEDDNAAKLNDIVNNLVNADYVVFFSNRLYGTVPRIPGRYPMSRRYYEKLFGEQLGFTLVYVTERYPNLLGVAVVDDTLADPGLPTPALLTQIRPAPITINLGHADESFSVYDHQRVLIFKKTARLSPDQLRLLIGPPPAPGDNSSTEGSPRYRSLLLSPAQLATVHVGGTFRDLFNRSDFFNQVPLAVWIVMTALIGLAAAPIGFVIFRFLPDRGLLVSKTLGVLVLAWTSWVAVSLGLGTATRLEAVLVFVLLLCVGATVAYLRRKDILDFVRHNRRLLLFEEGLFWVAFLYDVWVRSLNPDLWHPALGGEKPMDLAYLNAAIRSPIYPPYDPWYSGGYLNYYYFGQIIVGTLTKISGILPTTAYNLIVPLLFALTVGGAFTVAVSLISRGDAAPKRTELWGGVLASLMVCVLGNIGGFSQFAGEIAQASPSTTGGDPPGVGPVVNFFGGLSAIVFQGHPFEIPADWYWSSTRMLALLDIKGGTGSINEFPYFTFLFADLHAHLIALPLTLVVLALCVNLLKSRTAIVEDVVDRVVATLKASKSSTFPFASIASMSAAALGTVVVTGLAVGALYPTNSWDYPTYVGLIALALLVPWYASAQRSRRGLIVRLGALLAIVILSQVLYRPFSAYFQSFYSGIHPSDEKSEIRWYFVINGLFLVIMLSYFGLEGWIAYRRSNPVRSIRLFAGNWELIPRILELRPAVAHAPAADMVLFGYGLAALVGLVVAFVIGGMALTGILLVFLLAALFLALRRDRKIEDCFMILLFATGLAISIGTEQFIIDGDVGRMNTIFKFYEQIWVLFGIASAVAVIRIRDRLASVRSAFIRRGWAAVLVAFFVMSAVYPVLGTKARVSQRFDASLPLSLDGTAYMDHAVYADSDEGTHLSAQLHLATDKAAIQWLQDNVQGTPTVLEGTRPLYRWGSRIAIYTGLPTVIGWDWHQKQQRWGFQSTVDERTNDVQRMYNDPSVETTLALLKQYDVKYIIDGELEQGFYPRARAKFDALVGSTLTVAYDQSGVRIYQVK